MKFIAYANSQKHKMVIRTDNYHALENANEWLSDYINTDEIRGKQLLVEILDKRLPFMSVKGDNIKVGDLNFQRHFMLKKVNKMITERLSKATHRKTLLTKFGFDVKYGSHLIRLMLEGEELLKTGNLKFPLKYADILTDIKLGKWKMTDVLKYAEDIENRIDAMKTNIPSKPRYDEVQKLTIDLLKHYML